MKKPFLAIIGGWIRALKPVMSFQHLPEAARMGARAEKQAVGLLKSKKYKIIARNWRHKHWELDIVAKEGNILVFVEVRARSKNALVGGFASLTAKKRQALRQGAQSYVQLLSKKPQTIRWDVIEMVHDDKEKIFIELNHYENVMI